MSQMYEVVIKAAGEVRDAEGNLIENVTGEGIHIMSRDDLKANGLTDAQIDALDQGEPR